MRILWLGDSHSAADYLTGIVRRRLEERFGAGGPGFVRLGTRPYRHDAVRVERIGRWRMDPAPPSKRSQPGDPARGLGGVRALPLEREAWARARVMPKRARGRLRVGLWVAQAPGSSLIVSFGKTRESLSHAATEAGERLRHFEVEGELGDRLAVGGASGAASVLGAVFEGTEPGVVLDTVGIDGARVATALSWDPGAFANDVALRAPELVVLAYGTNEAFDTRPTTTIEGELIELVARARKGAPAADCLLVGPPDAATAELESLPRIVEIDAAVRRAALTAGCGYFGLRAAMGGDGSFGRWMREAPPLARGDRVHLTVKGYERLGAALAEALLAGFAGLDTPPG